VTTSFAGRARVASGSARSRTDRPYRVEVVDGGLALLLEETGSPVLRVGLERVVVRPLGRAGALVVAVDGAPVVVDFTDRHHGAGPARVVRRTVHALHGRRARRAFLDAVRGGR